MRCSIHKRYNGKLKPRISCIECWHIFLSQDIEEWLLDEYINYYETMKGCNNIETWINDDTIVYDFLIEKKKKIMENK